MQCADMYLSFEVNTSKVKSSHRIEMTYEKQEGKGSGTGRIYNEPMCDIV